MYYIMSDIHGSYKELKRALSIWDKEKDILVILGDLIDRGPDSRKVVQKLMSLQKKNRDKVIVLKGNHEDMFASWIKHEDEELLNVYYNTIHNEAISSFLGIRDVYNYYPSYLASEMKAKFSKEIEWLSNLPEYYEGENVIFVHAGINVEGDWKKDKEYMMWARNEFIYSKLKLHKRVFFGHTPTKNINKDRSNCVWENELGDRVAIDGGVSMKGQLNVLKVKKDGTYKASFVRL